jgi:hypothetical protein
VIKLHYNDQLNCLHFKGEIERADELIERFLKENKPSLIYDFSSDIFVLRIAQAIRAGILASNDVQIYCHKDENGVYDDNKFIRFDVKGDFIEPWVIDDLFEIAFHLRFSEYPAKEFV